MGMGCQGGSEMWKFHVSNGKTAVNEKASEPF